MKNQPNNSTEDEYAKNEPPVAANELLAEIELLIEDYFKGDVSFDGQNVMCCLPNGQKFKFSAEEIV